MLLLFFAPLAESSAFTFQTVEVGLSIFAQGAVLSHENLIANVAGSSLNIKFYPSDVLVFCIYTQIKLFVLDQLIQFTSALNICDNNFVDHSPQVYLISTLGSHLREG